MIKDDDTYVSQRLDNNTSWSALELPLVLITIRQTDPDKIKAEISALENTNT